MTAILSGHHYGALKMWPAVPESVGDARRCLTGYLVECGLARLADAAEVVLSELVTNAIMHAHPLCGGLIATRFELLPSGVRIEVHDASDVSPVPRDASMDADCGRGLALVDAVTGGQWGVSDRDGPGKCVWARVEDEARRDKPASRGLFLETAAELISALVDVFTGLPAVLK